MGGAWPSDSTGELVTNRPLSTTFCPQIALRNAEWKGKAHKQGRLDLFVLRVTEPRTKAFVFKRAGTNLGHENEILFATGAKLKKRSETMIHNQYMVGHGSDAKKEVPVYVLEVDIS